MATSRRIDGTQLAGALALVAMVLGTSGCFAKVVKEPAYDENGIVVTLRSETRGGDPIERGFTHPAVIAPVRITNILSRIEVRRDEKPDREPAIPTDMLYPIGEGVARALAKANPNQEVVVMATERKRNMAVFTQDYLTSLVVWNKDDKLYVKLGHLDWALPKNPNEKVSEPTVDKLTGKSRAVPSDGIAAEGTQLITANWRDPLFKDSGALHVRPGGQVVRRTVLMDSGVEPGATATEPTSGAPVPPQGLSPESLRALADLEESRRRGEMTEADYQAKRRAIVGGEPAPPNPASTPTSQ